MRFTFQKIRLEADSLYGMIGEWAEMQLEVTANSLIIYGAGFTPEIAEAFSVLLHDWEAAIRLPDDALELRPGRYDLFFYEDTLYACREQHKQWIADWEVVVEVGRVTAGGAISDKI